MKTCTVLECSNPILAKGLCKHHYQRQWRHSELTIEMQSQDSWKAKNKCKIKNCKNIRRAKGLCSKHYHRLTRHNSPNKVVKIHKYSDNTMCSVYNCSDHPIGRGLCSRHYRLYMRYGDPNKRRVHHKCKISYCNRGNDAHGYCMYHSHLIRMSGMKGEFEDIFGFPPYICHICGESYMEWTSKNLEADHVQSRKNGGENKIDNLKPACKRCNRIKRDLNFDDLVAFCRKVVAYQDSLEAHVSPT
jgi:hypothetical protein